MAVDNGLTFGALLIGGMFAVLFCGLTQAQTLLYFKLFPNDRTFIKCLVLFIWTLDTLHSAFIMAALWDHLIDHFGEATRIDAVPWSLGLTIATTAVLTFSVHCFLIYRIFQLSKGKYLLCGPLFAMAATRLSFACLTTSKLVQLKSLAAFVHAFTWSFTTGLAISTILDIFITASLVVLLRRRQQEFSHMNRVLDSLVLYTFETGGVTMVATGVCLITWVTMPENLIFMALHFIISKFYANSLLITLNTRANLKQSSFHVQSTEISRAGNVNVPFPNPLGRPSNAYQNVENRDLSSKHPSRGSSRKLSRFSLDLGSQIRSHLTSASVVDVESQQKGDLVGLEELPYSKGQSNTGLHIRVNIDKTTMVDNGYLSDVDGFSEGDSTKLKSPSASPPIV